MIRLGELMMILELHRQGLSVTAIARRLGRDPKTVRKHIERGVEAPAYSPRSVGRPGKLAPYLAFLSERVTAFPELSAARLTREIRQLGYCGAYTAVKRHLVAIRPQRGPKPYELRFETPPGVQAQVDFARFVVDFTDDPGTRRVVWLFSLVLGHSRFLFARYVLHQDLQTLLRCHIQAFQAIGGVPIEILYDRMKTAVTGEDDQGHIVYNRSLLALARHYRFQPRACRPYRAKTKGKVERPFSYIRQDFFLGRAFRNLDDLNLQLADWLGTVANLRVHGTTQRVVAEAFAAERPELQRLPEHRFDAVLRLERRVSHDGFVAIGGNYYSVPDRTRRIVEVQQLPDMIRILDLGRVVAEHRVVEGRRQYRVDRGHRTGGLAKREPGQALGVIVGRRGDHVPIRPLAIYQAIGAHLAAGDRS
jgi:transposase